jgi:hypothetical protein
MSNDDWFRFFIKLCGYELRRNGRNICKFEVYNEYRDSPNVLELILTGKHPHIKKVKKINPNLENIWHSYRKMAN